MTGLRAGVALLVALGLSACAPTKFLEYEGPEVTRVLVYKDQRRMHLLHGTSVLQSYEIGLGFAPRGDKKVEGDGKTPVGTYLIDRRNPNSRYHLSIGIDYPNARDRAEAASMGRKPGGDIFIHGRGKFWERNAPDDWTWGCIAVTDGEIEEIYAMVDNGTPITIYDVAPTPRTARPVPVPAPTAPQAPVDVTAPVVPAAPPPAAAVPPAAPAAAPPPG